MRNLQDELSGPASIPLGIMGAMTPFGLPGWAFWIAAAACAALSILRIWWKECEARERLEKQLDDQEVTRATSIKLASLISESNLISDHVRSADVPESAWNRMAVEWRQRCLDVLSAYYPDRCATFDSHAGTQARSVMGLTLQQNTMLAYIELRQSRLMDLQGKPPVLTHHARSSDEP